MTVKKLGFKKTYIMVVSVFFAIIFASFTACTFGVNKYYNNPSKWHGVDGNLQIDFETAYGDYFFGVLTLGDKTAKIAISNSEYAQTFSIYKKVRGETQSYDWLKTDKLNCVCLGDYSVDGDTVTFTILYDYTGFEGEDALLGRKIVCQKYA